MVPQIEISSSSLIIMMIHTTEKKEKKDQIKSIIFTYEKDS